MKLADLLARELDSWPCEGDELITQSAVDSEIYFGANGNVDYSFKPFINLSCRHSEQDAYPEVSMAQWQSARDKLKGETKVPKANKDGWIRHRGGKCPVAEGTIDVRFRNGDVAQLSSPEILYWQHDGDSEAIDIMAYRIHAPEQAISDDAVIDLCVVCADDEMPAATLDNPLAWRDRIKEIDTTVEALEDERSALIQRLADEGLALLRVNGKPMPSEPIKAEGSAQGEDMRDPANWKAGDMIVSLEEEEDISIGGTYHITEIYGNDVLFRDNAGDRRNRCASDYKWHSRPPRP